MRKILRFVTIGLFFLASQSSENDYRVQVTSVSVWIKALRSDGNPVTGLTASDFKVYEDGEKVPIDCFEEENASHTESSSALPPQKFVLLLDLYNTTPIEYARVKPQLQRFILSLYGKNHEVMLAAVLPNRHVGVICPFTRDLARVRILLNKASANPMRDVMIDRKYDELFRMYEQSEGDSYTESVTEVAHLVESLANQEKEESKFSLSALESLASYLNSDSRKHIVMLLLSGGFSTDPGRRFYEVADRLSLRVLNNDPLKSLAFKRSNFDFENELRRTVGKLSRSNVTIYTVDTRGVVRRKEYQDSLIEIADETGGLSFYNSSNFKEGFTRVLQDLRHQYVVCYSPPSNQKSGVYHSIKVACKKPDIDLRYRNGYFN
jgi:VWFA-related protein